MGDIANVPEVKKIIRRSDPLILLSFYEKQWKSNGKLPFVARHRTFPNDPRVTYISTRIPMWLLKEYIYSIFGAASPDEFQKSMDEVYGKPVGRDELFFLHVGNFIYK